MSQTHAPGEWLAFLSLGIGVHAAFSVPYFLFVDATVRDFDPRPALARVIESGRFDAALTVVGPAKADAHRAAERLALAALQLRDRTRLALYGALLVALLRLNAPKGNLR